ncbi:MAG: site-2 protease family protein [Candidatus Hydrogenedentales bacterium]
MFGKRVKIFELLGFSVYIDASWLVLALLVTWTLAVGYFPDDYPGLSTATYWIMGAVAMVGLFGSIVLHELSHSVVARRNGMHMKGITLFIFGGVADMDSEPPSAKAEFWMAIAGPIASVVIGAACYAIAQFAAAADWPAPIVGVIAYLAFINIVLVLFNMIPAFPLDGGRVLRAILWGWKKNIRWATRISSTIGAAFGFFLMALGVFAFISGNFIAGMWYFLIGMFVRNAAQGSYQQVLVRRVLEGEPISRFMNPNPITVAPDTRLDEVVENYVYRYHHKMFPVVDGDRLVGCVTTREIQEVPRAEWSQRTVADVMKACDRDNTIPLDADAMDALTRLSKTGTSRALVVDNGRLVGVVALKDLMRFLSLKIELEGDGKALPQLRD